jgi:hypothetical protein
VKSRKGEKKWKNGSINTFLHGSEHSFSEESGWTGLCEVRSALVFLILITVGGAGIGALIDWIIALTKLGSYEKDFVFVDKKWS